MPIIRWLNHHVDRDTKAYKKRAYHPKDPAVKRKKKVSSSQKLLCCLVCYHFHFHHYVISEI